MAKALLLGIERGSYHLPSPDLAQNLLLDSMASLTPKPLGLLGCLLSPIVYLITWASAGIADRAARRCNLRGTPGALRRPGAEKDKKKTT